MRRMMRVVLACAAVGVPVAAMAAGGKSANEKALHAYLGEFWDKGGHEIAESILAPEFSHLAPAPEHTVVGRDAFVRYVEGLDRQFRDVSLATRGVRWKGEDACFVDWTWSAVATGADGFTRGKEVSVSGTSYFTFRDGRLSREVTGWDNVGFIEDIGATPEATPEQRNAALAFELIDGVYVRGNYALCYEILSVDCQMHVPRANGPVVGRDAVRERAAALTLAGGGLTKGRGILLQRTAGHACRPLDAPRCDQPGGCLLGRHEGTKARRDGGGGGREEATERGRGRGRNRGAMPPPAEGGRGMVVDPRARPSLAALGCGRGTRGGGTEARRHTGTEGEEEEKKRRRKEAMEGGKKKARRH